MNKIKAIPALRDNYIWRVAKQGQALIVDPSQAEPVLADLRAEQLRLTAILLTHHHADHTAGVAQLLCHFPDCQVYGHDEIAEVNQKITDDEFAFTWQDLNISVWQVAGHTAHHLAYLLFDERWHVFCGDTLFSGGCGRVFPDSCPEWLFNSLMRLNALPENALFYPAHEYTANNLRFAQWLEPDNLIIQQLKRHLTVPSLPVSLKREREINPFLRVALPAMRERMQALTGKNLSTALEVFVAMRALKDDF